MSSCIRPAVAHLLVAISVITSPQASAPLASSVEAMGWILSSMVRGVSEVMPPISPILNEELVEIDVRYSR